MAAKKLNKPHPPLISRIFNSREFDPLLINISFASNKRPRWPEMVESEAEACKLIGETAGVIAVADAGKAEGLTVLTDK